MQAKECYEVIRKHNKQVIIMEVVKGGGLSKLTKQEIILPDGTNSTELVEKCVNWLKEHSF